MVRKQRKPHRYKKRKPIYLNRFFWKVILFLILFSFLIYFFLFSEFFKIKKINIHGLEKIEKELLENLIQEKINNIFLINLKETKQYVLEKIPEIAEIEINRNFPDKLNVLIKEKKGFAIFCFYLEHEEQKEECFILDKQGIVFETKKDQESLIKIIDQRKTELPVLGDKIIEEEKLARLLEINSELENNFFLLIKEFIFLPEKLIVKNEQGWEIYFNPDQDVKWQLTKLGVLLEEKVLEQERENLEYIELRFGNFANPKYKDKN